MIDQAVLLQCARPALLLSNEQGNLCVCMSVALVDNTYVHVNVLMCNQDSSSIWSYAPFTVKHSLNKEPTNVGIYAAGSDATCFWLKVSEDIENGYLKRVSVAIQALRQIQALWTRLKFPSFIWYTSWELRHKSHTEQQRLWDQISVGCFIDLFGDVGDTFCSDWRSNWNLTFIFLSQTIENIWNIQVVAHYTTSHRFSIILMYIFLIIALNSVETF